MRWEFIVDKTRAYAHLFLAGVIGLLTAVGLYNYLSMIQPRAEVVVATRDIPADTRIQKNMVRPVAYPSMAVHPAAAVRPEEVVGRVVLTPLYRGEQILRTRLSQTGQGAAAAGRLDGGERAMFIPLGTGRYPAAFVRPGQVVDVVLVADAPGGGAAVARLVLAGLRVLSVIPERGGSREGDGGGLTGAVVAVDVGQAEKLAFALEQGKVHLLAAERGDVSAQGSGATWETLFPAGAVASRTLPAASGVVAP